MQRAKPVRAMLLSDALRWSLIVLGTIALISTHDETRTVAFIGSAACHERQLESSGRHHQLNTAGEFVVAPEDPIHESAASGATRSGRHKRAAPQQRAGQQTTGRPAGQPDVTRVVAVSGQTMEFQCPLAGELLEQTHANPESNSATSQQAEARQRIIWRKDGQPLSQMNSTRLRLSQQPHSSNLTILQAQSRLDEGTYECALQEGDQPHRDKAAKLHQFQLKLLVAPRLAPFEFPADAQVGMKALLTCSALEGQQPISFVWLRDNQVISQVAPAGGEAGGKQVGPGVASLGQLHQQQLADKFALSAHASISLSDSSQYVVINEEEAASTRLRPEAAELKAAPASMQLADASIRIRQADDYSILSIEPLELKHSGRYTCSAQNEAARVSHSSQLVINAPPTLTIEPKDGDLVSGHSLVLDCAASGQPRPQLSWSRAREPNDAKPWDFVPIYDNLRYAILPNGSLAISNATQREQGLYMCSARNGFGPEVTKLIRITIHEPARIGAKYKLVEARVEEQAKMSCEAQGEPPLTLEWLDKEGKLIDKNDKRFIIDHSASSTQQPDTDSESSARKRQAKSQPGLSSASSELIIARAARSHSGHYTCQAGNKHGQDKMVANLLVQDVPGKVDELKVTNATAGTISLRWQLGFTGNAPVTSYLIQYQSDDPLDDLLMSAAAKGHQTAGGGGGPAESPAADSTTPASQWTSSRLYKHLFGPGSASNGHESKEQASSIKEALETLNSLSASLGDLSVSSADEAIDRTLVELSVQQTATSLTIKELNPYCVYRLRLAGINKIGLGEFSDWIRAKTEEAPPSGSALKIAAAATGPNSIKLSWFPPDRRTWNGQLVRFQIGYRPIDSTYELNKSIEWTPPTLMQSIMLDVSEKRKQQRLVGGGAVADPAGGGGRPQNQLDSSRAPPTDTGAANVSVAQPADGKSPYALRQHLRQLLAMQQQELVAHLTNLQRSTTYLVWVQAANGRGLGPQSHAVSVKTLDDVPPSAPALHVQSSNVNSVTISWSMLSNFVSPANLYSLFYRRVPPPPPPPPSQPGAGPQLYPTTTTTNSSRLQQLALDSPMVPAFTEPGPFQERTISSQQLLVHGSAGLGPPANFRSQFHGDSADSVGNQQFVYTLDQLDCGSVYELYMTTRNSVGKSEPSAIVSARTLGEPPLAPHNKNNLFVRIGAQDVLLNLASWSTGGCPLTQVNVRYKQLTQPVVSLAASSDRNVSHLMNGGSKHQQQQHPSFSVAWPMSTSVPVELLDAINMQQRHLRTSNSRNLLDADSGDQMGAQHGGQQLAGAQFALKSLQPSTGYELEIVAHNAAGHTTAQYEFVTAGPNGTRSGYTRREGVFRLDQRGQPIETAEQVAIADQPFAAHPHQQQQFASNGLVLQQLVPLILVMLCFVCLVISSAFCYNRLAANWKQQRARRHSIDGFRSICSAASTSGHDSHAGLPKLGPGWSTSTSTRCGAAPPQQSQQLARGLHSELVDDQTPSTINTSSGSPAPPNQDQAGFNYCARGSNADHLMSATLNPKSSFSQSVSMRDFNVMNQASGAALNHYNNHHHHHRQLIKNGRATLANSKVSNSGGLAHDFVKIGATAAATMARGRRALLDVPDGGGLGAPHIALTEAHQYGNMQRACPSNPYGQTLASGCKHKLDQIYDLYGPLQQQQQQHDACNHPHHNHPAQSYETSWTTTATPTANTTNTDQQQAANYAIPAGYQMEPAAIGAEQSHACDDLYGQDTIDACIQHLMQQQCPQEAGRPQPSYAMISRHANEVVSGGPNRSCNMYADQDANLFVDLANANQMQQQQEQEQAYDQHHARATSATNYAINPQSVIESSSGSSGIGLESLTGASSQMGCVANQSAPNAANSRSYQQQQQHQHQQQVAAADQQQQTGPADTD